MRNLYTDIATRTGGDIYIGLVNIRFLFHGRTTPVQWLCFAVTLLYIGYWLLYSRKVPNAGITAYTVLFFVFMAGFAAARFDWNSSLLLNNYLSPKKKGLPCQRSA